MPSHITAREQAELMVTVVYKVVSESLWETAIDAGELKGSPVDLADGFIHLSTAEQLPETLRRHFAGQVGLLILKVDVGRLLALSGDRLRWEPSRGGDLFPHLYGPLPVEAVAEVTPFAV